MSRPRRILVVDAVAPAERLAVFRVLLGIFVVVYVLLRVPVYLGFRHRPDAAFEGVGILSAFSAPLPHLAVVLLLIATLLGGVAFTLGLWFRWTAPIFAGTLLVLCTARSSFGQLLHFENLFVLHVAIIAWSPADDAWALHPRWAPGRRADRRPSESSESSESSTAYGFPLALAAMVTAITYLVAGVAKLRYGGTTWLLGDALRNHVAYAATRLDLLGADPAPLAAPAIDHDWVFTPMAVGTVVLETSAPLALLGRGCRWIWSGLAWTMHIGIVVFMLIGFPYPLSGLAFAPLFDLEVLRHPRARLRRFRAALTRACERES